MLLLDQGVRATWKSAQSSNWKFALLFQHGFQCGHLVKKTLWFHGFPLYLIRIRKKIPSQFYFPKWKVSANTTGSTQLNFALKSTMFILNKVYFNFVHLRNKNCTTIHGIIYLHCFLSTQKIELTNKNVEFLTANNQMLRIPSYFHLKSHLVSILEIVP